MDNSIKFLMHMDEATLKEELGSQVISTNAKYSTTQKKFGNGSAYFSNSNSYIKVKAGINNLNFGSSDFTVDFWLYFDVNQNVSSQIFQNTLATTWATNCIAIHDVYTSATDNRVTFWIYNNNPNAPTLCSTTVLQKNNWYHIAIIRNSGICKLYINGKAEASATYTGNLNFCIDTNGLCIGAGLWQSGTYGMLNAYIDEFRISNIARWTANFSVPTTGDYNYFLIEDATQIKFPTISSLNYTHDTPLLLNDFMTNGVYDLTLVDSIMINRITNQKYNIALYKRKL